MRLSPRTAVQLAQALAPYGVGWFEEPVLADDIQGLADGVAPPVAGHILVPLGVLGPLQGADAHSVELREDLFLEDGLQHHRPRPGRGAGLHGLHGPDQARGGHDQRGTSGIPRYEVERSLMGHTSGPAICHE